MFWHVLLKASRGGMYEQRHAAVSAARRADCDSDSHVCMPKELVCCV